MAIKLNKLAIRCAEIALANGKITSTSSSRVMLYDISKHWRNLCDASGENTDPECAWSEKERTAAELMISSMVYLQRIGCTNIEQLLRQTIDRHSARNKED